MAAAEPDVDELQRDYEPDLGDEEEDAAFVSGAAEQPDQDTGESLVSADGNDLALRSRVVVRPGQQAVVEGRDSATHVGEGAGGLPPQDAPPGKLSLGVHDNPDTQTNRGKAASEPLNPKIQLTGVEAASEQPNPKLS